ncbi:MAG: insulinase family protein [Prevotella sp.]|nr:insulinase family protein [Prevotella sp.]
MKLRNLLATLLVFVCATTQAQQMPPIPVDEAVRIGKLDNGLTYYIRHNNWPEHRANFYIAQKVGSIQEEESQRGLAHFLEHMAFNGSDHFKGNQLISWLESIGVQFGGDLNAYTSIDQTVYNIDNVPTARQSALDSCMLILRDWSTGLLLEPEEIDKERGVIHEEWRMRTSANSRMLERNLPALYPGSKYGVRYPIGLMSVIDNFSPQELRDYYEKWYHPSNQGLIIVGDIDIDHTEAMIKQLFSDITNPENAAPIVAEPVPDTAEPIVIIDKDKEQRTSAVEVMFKHDTYPDSLKGDMSYLIYNYVKGATLSLLNRRLSEVAEKADCPFVSASARDGNYIFSKTKDALDLTVVPKEMSMMGEALQALVAEARRVAEFGYMQSEYDRYKADYLSSLEKSYSNRDKRYNSQFYAQCRGHFLANEPMPPIEFTYQTMNQIVPAIPFDAVNSFAKELFSVVEKDSNMVVVSFNNEKEGNVYPTREGLLASIGNARSQQLEAYVDNVKNEPLIAQLPKPGKIKKEIRNEKFGYTELKLSNGVTVLMKHTDFKKDQVLLSGKGPGGESLYGPNDYRNLQLLNNAVSASGLGNFSSQELSKALAGKIANAGVSMNGRHMMASGSSTPKDVETMLQLLYLKFTNISKDEKSYQNLISQLEVSLKNRSLSPETALSDSLTATIYGHNPRLEPLTIEALKDVDYDRMLEIMRERTASARDWTFYLVGNYDEQTIRPLICQYLGSLPAKGKAVKAERISFLQKGKINNTFNRKQETPKCNAYMIWFNEDMPFTLERSIQANITGQILRMVYTKEIREEASAAYSVSASGSAGLDDDGYHLVQFYAYCPMQPEKRETAVYLLEKGVNDLAVSCDPEKLDKVKEVMLKRADDDQKENSHWHNVIQTWHEDGIDMNTDYKATVQAQTPEKISAFVKEVLSSGNFITVMMLPEE